MKQEQETDSEETKEREQNEGLRKFLNVADILRIVVLGGLLLIAIALTLS